MRPIAPLVRSLVCVLSSSVTSRYPLVAQGCASGPVALESRATLLLPASAGIQGIAAGPAGALALWSAGGDLFLVNHERSLTRRQLPDSIGPAGIAITPDGLRLLDRATGREFLLRADGSVELTGQARLGMAEQIDQALWWRDGWILGLRDLASRRFVLRRFTSSDERVLYRSAQSDSVKTIHRYHLTESAQGLLLTRSMAPFTVIRFDPLSGAADTLAPPLATAVGASIPADSLAHWRALPTVALDCTLLLTLTDLTADRRLLVRYGADDRVARVSELDAPLGLVTRLPGEDAVLAARRAGELELVWYDWHWVGEPSSPLPSPSPSPSP